MGIQGLLPTLKDIIIDKNIESLNGKVLAIDGYCWLHRGIFTCAEEVSQGIPSNKIFFLKENGIVPYVVFDGGYLPAKEAIEVERKRHRENHREMGLEHAQQGKRESARQSFLKSIDVTPEMAFHVIQYLKKYEINYVVAPYEADAQISYMCREKIVDGVISEDSDCIPYGCSLILFKMNAHGGYQEFSKDRLHECKTLNLRGFDEAMVLDMCILAGCDYLPSIPGMGIKKAHGLVKKYGSSDKVLRMLRFEGKWKIPFDYEKGLKNAKLTFLHQRVYDPRTSKMEHLTPYSSSSLESNIDFLGKILSHDLCKRIALGEVDPITHEIFCTPSVEPLKFPISNPSVHKKKGAPRTLSSNKKRSSNSTVLNYFTNETKKVCREKDDIENWKTDPNIMLSQKNNNIQQIEQDLDDQQATRSTTILSLERFRFSKAA